MPSASRSSVAQLSVSASQLIKLIKSVSSLVLKNENSLLWSGFFYKKRRLISKFNQKQSFACIGVILEFFQCFNTLRNSVQCSYLARC